MCHQYLAALEMIVITKACFPFKLYTGELESV